MKSVEIKKYIKNLNLDIVNDSGEETLLLTSEVNRIGLQLVEYYEHFIEKRIQIVGNSEWAYLKELTSVERTRIAEKLMEYKIPCIVFAKDLDVFQEFIEVSIEKKVYILKSNDTTTRFVSKSLEFLDKNLSKVITMHGVLVDVYGIGIFISGKSGVGKSETALELIKRGHRFIGDDAIDIRRKGEETIIGEAPQIIRNLLEIRGIGIIDISRLYGIGAVREEKQIDLIIELEEWDQSKQYDRLGLDDKHKTILDVEVSKIEIPIKPGRNLAVIVEVAAINHRQKEMGYNAAVELENRLLEN